MNMELSRESGEVQASTAGRVILTGLGSAPQNLGERCTFRVEPLTATTIASSRVFVERETTTQVRRWFVFGSFPMQVSVRPAPRYPVPELFSEEVTRCKERLFSFQQFRDGWYNGDGIAPSTLAIATANFMLDQKTQLASVASVFPAIEGGFLFEFKLRGWDYSIEINNKGVLEFLGVELGGPNESGPRTFTGHNAIGKLLEQLRKVGM